MRHFGLYEPVIESALERTHPAPWSVDDLNDSEAWIDEEKCQHIYPNCRPQNVIEWLHSLSPSDREELIGHLNVENT